MLVLSRKLNEAIVIDDVVRVTVLAIKGDRVRLGIEAPRHVPVNRAEIQDVSMQIVEIPFAPAGAVCDDEVDLGALIVAGSEDTQH